MNRPTVTYFAESIFVSRTFWFNVGSAIVAVCSAAEVLPLLPVRWVPGALAIASVVNILLRFDTVRPVALVAPGAVVPVVVEKLAEA